jgi:hypothetical protein
LSPRGPPGPGAAQVRRTALAIPRHLLDERAFLSADEEARAGIDVHLDPSRIDADLAGKSGLELGAAAVVDQAPDRAGVAAKQEKRVRRAAEPSRRSSRCGRSRSADRFRAAAAAG